MLGQHGRGASRASAAAYYVYRVRPATAEKAAAAAAGVYHLSLNKLYVDEMYNLLFVQPLTLLAGHLPAGRGGGVRPGPADRVVPRLLADVVRPLQNGLVQFYALAMVLGVVVFIGYLVLFAKS